MPIYTTLSDGERGTLTRASVKDVYGVILKDLEESKANARPATALQEEGISRENISRMATRQAALALYAKVALYAESFEESRTAADELLNDNFYQFELEVAEVDRYKEIFKNGSLSWEAIFTAFAPKPHELTQGYYFQSPPEGRYEYQYQPNQQFDFSNDPRMETIIEKVSENHEIIKYQSIEDQTSPSYVIRYAEILLIKSEAAAQLGDNTLASDTLNLLRKNRGMGAAINGDILESIWRERMIELAFEGSNEWFDAIRFDKIQEVNPRIKFSHQFVLPVPQAILDLNENLRQVSFSATPDDLTRIKGIGPLRAEILVNAGISSFEALASLEIDSLREIIQNASLRVGQSNLNTWIPQAQLARDGKWEELAEFQSNLQ